MVFLARQLPELGPVLKRAGVLRAALVGALAYGGVVVANGMGWYWLLRGVDERCTPVRAIWIFVTAQFAKYIPGNVAQHLGRIALSQRQGLNPVAVTFTMLVESLWAISSALLLSILALAMEGGRLMQAIEYVPSLPVLAILAGGALALPLATYFVIFRWRPGPLSQWELLRKSRTIRALPLAAALAVQLLTFLALGALLLNLASTMSVEPTRVALRMLTGIVALSWVAGYLAPGAPAGIGVREFVLLSGLSLIFDTSLAASLTLLFRLMTSGGDLLAVFLGRLLAVWMK